jgi:uncharacterized protein YabE (DUF348 family)/3D (Asp-Asp-Asp) domain-containing protein
MTKLLLRSAALFLVLFLAAAAAAIPDSLLALSVSQDKFPAVVQIISPEGEIKQVTYSKTLIEAIDEAGVPIGENDLLSLPDNTALLPGQRYEVTVTRLEKVKLTWRGFSLSTSGEFTTMTDLLSRSGYSALDLSDGSRIEKALPELDSLAEIALNFVGVDKQTTRQYEDIPFSSITIDDDTLYIGQKVVKVKGVVGKRALIFEETYENGIFLGSVQTGTEIVKEPIQKVIHRGTKPRITYTAINRKAMTGAVLSSLSKISGYLTPQGNKSYSSFTDNGNGTITVDGQIFDYTSLKNRTITMFDGLDCCLQARCHKPAINHNTCSGVPAQRGLVATYGVNVNGKMVGTVLPMGTIIFVEGYGLGVVADVHGAEKNPDMIDACFDPGDTRTGVASFGKMISRVYILKLP